MVTNKLKFTREQIIEALKVTGGFITHAAEVLGCSYVTVNNYMKNDPSIAVENEQIKEGRLDLAESELIKLMKAGEYQAIQFYLKYMGRKRGYIKAQKIELTDDLSKLMEAADNRMKK